jgi:hypothetical protein
LPPERELAREQTDSLSPVGCSPRGCRTGCRKQEGRAPVSLRRSHPRLRGRGRTKARVSARSMPHAFSSA